MTYIRTALLFWTDLREYLHLYHCKFSHCGSQVVVLEDNLANTMAADPLA